MIRMRKLFGRLVENEEGTSVIEFGLFAPILLTMLMGITDVAMAYSYKLQLEQAVYRSLERVQATNTVAASYAYLDAEAAAAAEVGTDDVEVESWLECNETRQAATVLSCPNGNSQARYVGIEIESAYTPFFPLGLLATDANGDFPVEAAASVRVE